MKKILVPTDFSKQATSALKLAHQIALKTKAEIVLAHVVEVPSSSGLSLTGEVKIDDMENIFIIKMIEQSKNRIRAMAEDSRFHGVKIHTDVQVGSPFVQLSSLLNAHEVDLTVMGTQGSSGLDEIFLGSNAEKMVRNAKCPVISVKTDTDLSEIRNIVFATDLKGNLDKVVSKLLILLEVTGAKLHLLKVNTPSNFISSRIIKKNLEEFKTKYALKDASINIYSDVDEEDGIIYFAEENKMDMIALATRGRTGLMHLLSGSIAEDIVNHAKRPVWTFRNK